MKNPHEREIVQRLTSNFEATMSEAVSRSVGMVILELLKHYLEAVPEEAQLETLYQECLRTLRGLAVKDFFKPEEYGNSEHERFRQELKAGLSSSIEYMISKAGEPLSELDVVTLYHDSREETYEFPLKVVLSLIVKAHLDDAKFSHAYTGSEEERLRQARLDRPVRLFSLFRCFKRAQGICHTGIRHELVSSLNEAYEGIYLIEDVSATVISFLRERLVQGFREGYKQDRDLIALLYEWMETQNPTALFSRIDSYPNPDSAILVALKLLISSHGMDPEKSLIKYGKTSLNLDAYVTAILSNLPFADAPDSILSKLNVILNLETTHPHYHTRNQARLRAIEWIKEHFDLSSVSAKNIIQHFYTVDEACREFSRYQQLLVLTHVMSAEAFTEKMHRFEEYYQDVRDSSGATFSDPGDALILFVEACKREITEAKSTNITDKVSNFFAIYFMAYDSKNLADLKSQYAFFLLLGSAFSEKIILTDENVSAFLSQSTMDGFHDITSYEINRFFLHAIIMCPQDWSPLFAGTFGEILAFVERGLGQEELSTDALKSTSYPPELIAQLRYLKEQWEFQAGHRQEAPTSVERLILMPKQVRTAKEWLNVSSLLNDVKRAQTYASLRTNIERRLLEFLKNTPGQLYKVICSLPENHYQTFLLQLLANRISLNQWDKNDCTLAHVAAEFGKVEVIKALWEAGADLNERDKFGCTPAYVAARRGYADVIKALEEAGADLNQGNNVDCTPAHAAAACGKVEVIKALWEAGADLNQRDKDGRTPAHDAAGCARVEVIKALWEAGADLNQRDKDGRTPANIAAACGYAEVIKALVEAGADLNQGNNVGRTPACVAAACDNVEVIKALGKAGADLNQRDNDGRTPAYVAACRGNVEVIKALWGAGADLSQGDKDGRTPAHAAVVCAKIEVIKALGDAGADLNQRDKNGHTPAYAAACRGNVEVIKALGDAGADLNQRDKNGHTPAYAAACRGNVEVIKALWEAGADLNQRDNDGCTPAHAAACRGNVEVIKALWEAGADLNQGDKNGCTPAHAAVVYAKVEVIKALGEAGADLNQGDKDGRTPAHIAAQEGYFFVIKTLLEMKSYKLTAMKMGIDNFIALISNKRKSEISSRFKDINDRLNFFLDSQQDKKGEISILPREIAYILGHNNIVEAFDAYSDRSTATTTYEGFIKNGLFYKRGRDSEIEGEESPNKKPRGAPCDIQARSNFNDCA